MSHRAAGIVWAVDGVHRAPIELSSPGRGRNQRGMVVHYGRSLASDEITRRDGLPVTTIARTLLDLAAVLEPRDLERALESALRARLLTVDELVGRLRSTPPTVGGRRTLRRLLEQRSPITTESDLETLVLQALRDGGLPEPERQHEVFDEQAHLVGRIDLAYPKVRLAIEADSYRFHSTVSDLRRDRARQNALVRMRWTVYRATWDDVINRPRKVAEDVAELLVALSGDASRAAFPVP